jgi:hypothetical protein
MLLAGVGVAEMSDKILPGKISGYEPVSPGLRPGRKLLIFLGSMGAGAIAWNFINRKFHIIARRHAPRRKKGRRSRR